MNRCVAVAQHKVSIYKIMKYTIKWIIRYGLLCNVYGYFVGERAGGLVDSHSVYRHLVQAIPLPKESSLAMQDYNNYY